MKNYRHNQIRTCLYLTQVQVVLYAIISAIIGFVASPLSKSHVVVTVSNVTCTHMKIEVELIWQRIKSYQH